MSRLSVSKADEPNNNIKKVGNDLGGQQTDAACIVCHGDFAFCFAG